MKSSVLMGRRREERRKEREEKKNGFGKMTHHVRRTLLQLSRNAIELNAKLLYDIFGSFTAGSHGIACR